MPNDEAVVTLKRALAELPTVADVGLMKAREGPPLPAEFEVYWPKPIREFTAAHWPGVPISREWGEAIMPRLPLGLGHVVLKVIDTFGL